MKLYTLIEDGDGGTELHHFPTEAERDAFAISLLAKYWTADLGPMPADLETVREKLDESGGTDGLYLYIETIDVPAPELGEDARRRAAVMLSVMQWLYSNSNPDECLRDALTDLRHMADAVGLDFGARDQDAYNNYSGEVMI